jgi:hypothetical protein
MKSSILILLTGLIYLTNYNLHAQNAPISTIGAIETYDDSATVFIRVSGFSNITGCDLKINYDPEIVVVTSVSEGPNILHNFFIPDFTEPGKIDI